MALQCDRAAIASAAARPKPIDTAPVRRPSPRAGRIPLFAAMLLLGGVAAHAAAPAAIPAVGGATFTIDGRADPTAGRLCAATAGAWNAFELLLDQPAKPAPEHVAVLGAAVNGGEPAGARDAIRLSLTDDAEPLLKLRVCVDTDRLLIPGTWTVQGLVRWPGGDPAERSFAFSIVHRPAVVQVPANLTLELGADGGFAPDGISVLETGGESGIRALTAVADPIETAEASAQIVFPTPVTIGPRGSAVLIPKLTGALPLGSVVSSPQASKFSSPHDHCTVPAPNTSAPLGARYRLMLWVSVVPGLAPVSLGDPSAVSESFVFVP